MLKSKKGVTPVIAIVLLLMMTVAAGGMAWKFIQSTIAKQQQQTTAALEDITEEPLKVIQATGLAGMGENITFLVKNPGRDTRLYLTNVAVKINGVIDPRLDHNDLSGSCTGTIQGRSTCSLVLNLTDVGLTFPNINDPVMSFEFVFMQGPPLTYDCISQIVGVC